MPPPSSPEKNDNIIVAAPEAGMSVNVNVLLLPLPDRRHPKKQRRV
jgi:hypothetical protein